MPHASGPSAPPACTSLAEHLHTRVPDGWKAHRQGQSGGAAWLSTAAVPCVTGPGGRGRPRHLLGGRHGEIPVQVHDACDVLHPRVPDGELHSALGKVRLQGVSQRRHALIHILLMGLCACMRVCRLARAGDCVCKCINLCAYVSSCVHAALCGCVSECVHVSIDV